MTRIDDVSTNDMNLKHLDTTKDIVITPRNEFGGQVLLNPAHTWTAKVSDGNNYIGDYPVKLDSNGIVVNSSEFTKLPAGQYHLEVWEEWIDSNDKKQRSIYPSPQRTIDFTIYQNITDLAEKEIKTIGFQDVVDQAVMNVWDNYVIKVNTIEPDQTATVAQAAADGKNYVTFNIPRGDKGDTGATGPQGPKGDKGDTGTVDNAGLITAPAFQALQKQVNNSAVGNNLLVNTSNSATSRKTTIPGTSAVINGVYSRTDSYEQVTTPTPDELYYRFMVDNPSNLYGLTPGETYTLSGSASYTTGKLSFRAVYSNNGVSWVKNDVADLGISVSDGSVFTPFSHTFTIPVGVTGVFLSLQNYNYTTDGLFRFNNMKLEKGSVATDWSPNPSEILTQGDYAKIQAAIVALGGSLS